MDGLTIKPTEGLIRTVPDQSWQVAGVGDLDGDRKADIVWRKSSTGENYLYPMDGLTIKSTEGPIRTVADTAWRIRGVADLDGDGKADIVWRHSVTGSNYLFPMDGTTIKPTEGYLRAVADLTWQLAALGDYDGDGKADILWRNGQELQPSREYVYLGDIPVAVLTSTSATPFYVQVDHLNTPRLVANQQGQTVWRWDQQEPFGVSPANENPSGLGAFEFPMRFPGEYFDKETNLHYNYFRDYDPSLGRYGQSDPVGLRAGLNTYAYVESDPLSYIDPNGLQLAPGGALGGSSGLGVGGALGGRGLIPGKQRPDDPAGALGEYMQPGATPTDPILATSVNPDEVIAGAAVPPFPGVQNLSADCKPGKRVVFVIARGTHKGRTNIEQEYQCTCGLVTWHLIVTPNGKIVHNHFRTGGAKGTADD